MSSFSEPEFDLVGGSLCLDLINTLDNRFDPGRQKELLPTYKELLAFSVQSNVIAPKQAQQLARRAEQHRKNAAIAHRELIRLRECLNRIFRALIANTTPAQPDLHELNSFIQDALAHMSLTQYAGSLVLDLPNPESDLKFLQWSVARSAADLLTSDDAHWLRLCDCDWFFVDRSRNHSRKWCDMKICGNREKVRRFYARARTKS
jgi:predicted RNA-binding Zn ribbon-like protein